MKKSITDMVKKLHKHIDSSKVLTDITEYNKLRDQVGLPLGKTTLPNMKSITSIYHRLKELEARSQLQS